MCPRHVFGVTQVHGVIHMPEFVNFIRLNPDGVGVTGPVSHPDILLQARANVPKNSKRGILRGVTQDDGQSQRDSNQTNSLIHLYRGELGRMTSYRVRLDTTTNWAVVTTAGIVTFALGNPAVSHVVFILAMVLTLFFLNLEAGRFRIYETAHQRVRLLELGFFAQALGGTPEPNWEQTLLDDLREPESPVSQLAALGWRLRRTYLWVYTALVLAWWGKLTLAHQDSRGALTEAAIGSVPGWAVAGLVGGFYLLLVIIAVVGSRRYPVGAD